VNIEPAALRRFHGIATIIWALLVLPTMLLWKNSIPWLAGMSVWANLASHFSAWQASRTEVRQEQDQDSAADSKQRSAAHPREGGSMCRFWSGPRVTNRQLAESLQHLHRKADRIMATQQQLDEYVARIGDAVAGIRQDIADIKAANPELDLSGLEERVAGLESLDAENPAAPAEPTE
jgi:hypothetical protein